MKFKENLGPLRILKYTEHFNRREYMQLRFEIWSPWYLVPFHYSTGRHFIIQLGNILSASEHGAFYVQQIAMPAQVWIYLWKYWQIMILDINRKQTPHSLALMIQPGNEMSPSKQSTSENTRTLQYRKLYGSMPSLSLPLLSETASPSEIQIGTHSPGIQKT